MAAKKKSSLFLTSKEMKKEIGNRLKMGAGVVLGRLSSGLVQKVINKGGAVVQGMGNTITIAAGGALAAYAANPILEGVGYGIASDAAYEMAMDMMPASTKAKLGLSGASELEGTGIQALPYVPESKNSDSDDFLSEEELQQLMEEAASDALPSPEFDVSTPVSDENNSVSEIEKMI